MKQKWTIALTHRVSNGEREEDNSLGSPLAVSSVVAALVNHCFAACAPLWCLKSTHPHHVWSKASLASWSKQGCFNQTSLSVSVLTGCSGLLVYWNTLHECVRTCAHELGVCVCVSLLGAQSVLLSRNLANLFIHSSQMSLCPAVQSCHVQ